MAYLLDSDIVIDQLGDDVATRRLLDRLSDAGLLISMVTYMEVYQGTLVNPDPAAAQAKLDEFLRGVPIVPFSQAVAQRCAQLRTQLQRERKPVRARALDLLNAATALEHDLTLVTRNLRDYEDIPELSLYQAS